MIRNPWKYYLAIVGIILIDQALKLYVHFGLNLGITGKSINLIGNLLKLSYTLNPGMAFGINLGCKYGKLMLTIIRVIASGFMFLYIIQLIRNNHYSKLWIWGWVLVLGGAVGNAIDSIFYAIFLKNAPADAPMQWGHGQVIDMIHVDIWSGILPKWVPFLGGQGVYCLPIFNIADVAIFIGLLLIILVENPDKQNVTKHVMVSSNKKEHTTNNQ